MALATALVAVALAAGTGAAAPTPALAASAFPTATDTSATTTVESSILSWINRDRAARSLRPLRLDGAVRTLARERASNLAAAATFSHDAAGGPLGSALAADSIQFWSAGEAIAWTIAPPGSIAASSMYSGLKKSAAHWALLMSRTYNYVGIGVAERTSDHRTFLAIVLTESRDHTPPYSKVTSATRSGTTVTFHWYGKDRPLQTHTAGFRDFDVEYRVDDGAWRLVRDNTTSTGTSWTNRVRGHTYWVRVRGRDRAGNCSPWSAPMGVRVP